MRSAAETKSPGPLRETCRFSTSPKSRFSERDAFITASVITVIRGERIIDGRSLTRVETRGQRAGRVAGGLNDEVLRSRGRPLPACGRRRAAPRTRGSSTASRPSRASQRADARPRAARRGRARPALRSFKASSSQVSARPWAAATMCQAAASTLFWAAAARGVEARKAVLRDGVAPGGGAAKALGGQRFVRRDAFAVEEQDGVFDLAGDGCRSSPRARTSAPQRRCPGRRRVPAGRARRARAARRPISASAARRSSSMARGRSAGCPLDKEEQGEVVGGGRLALAPRPARARRAPAWDPSMPRPSSAIRPSVERAWASPRAAARRYHSAALTGRRRCRGPGCRARRGASWPRASPGFLLECAPSPRGTR